MACLLSGVAGVTWAADNIPGIELEARVIAVAFANELGITSPLATQAERAVHYQSDEQKHLAVDDDGGLIAALEAYLVSLRFPPLERRGQLMAVSFVTGVFGFMERSTLSALRPGLVVAVALGAMATFMSRGLGGPLARSPLLMAILIGCLIGNSFGCPESLRPGLTFTIRRLLRLAVALVGFRITAHQVVDLGIGPFLIAAGILTVTFVFTVWAAQRFFSVERDMASLLAAGSAVCGAAAVLAVAEVVRARPQQTALAVTLITVLGTLTLLAYPVAFATGTYQGWERTPMACSLEPPSMRWHKSLVRAMPSRSWQGIRRLWSSSAKC